MSFCENSLLVLLESKLRMGADGLLIEGLVWKIECKSYLNLSYAEADRLLIDELLWKIECKSY